MAGFWGRLAQAVTGANEQQEAEKRAYPLELFALGYGEQAKSGVSVTEDTALTYSAVWACVRIISESIASLPLHLMRTEGRNRYAATAHPLYGLLHSLPNQEQTAMEWRQMLFSQTLLWGTGFSEKVYDKRGNLIALWPLLSRNMESSQRRPDGRWWGYRLPDGRLSWIHQDYLHIVRGLSGDGVWGFSPIRVAAMEAVGLGLATEEFGGRFFSNGSHLGGILEHPGRLSVEAHGRLRASINEQHGGLTNAHRLKILEEGMSYKAVGIPPDAAQFLETRRFQVTEIARIYRVPPHMLADLERATFSNVEHLGQEFVTYTLRPWLVGHEQAIFRDLLDVPERVQYFARYNVNGLLRGDITARYQAYNTGIVAGFMTRNEARELEDWNPLDGLDEPLVPLNMAGVEDGGRQKGEGEGKSDEPVVGGEGRSDGSVETRALEVRQERVKVFNRFVRLFDETTGRLVRRETADIRRALPRLEKQGIEAFREWLATFYGDLKAAVPGYYDGLLRTYAEQVFDSVGEELQRDAPTAEGMDEWFAAYLDNYATRYTVTSESVLRGDLNQAEADGAAPAVALGLAGAAILARLDLWETTKANKTGQDQAFEAGNALALHGYGQRGVNTVVWMGGDCPLCAKFNGTRQRIGTPFAQDGDTVDAGDGVTAALPVTRTIRHGPLHGGCDCTVMAG